MKSILITLTIIAFAGIANAQTECNSEFKAVAGVQDIGHGDMNLIVGFNYNVYGKKDVLGGFVEAKYLNAETVAWIGGAYQTHFQDEFYDKELEVRLGTGIRSDSSSELFIGTEIKMQFPYFAFNAGTELNMELNMEYVFIAQYAMCPSTTYFGVAADSHNGYGFHLTHIFEFESSILSFNGALMSNNFDTMKSDDFGFTDLDPMIQMSLTFEF